MSFTGRQQGYLAKESLLDFQCSNSEGLVPTQHSHKAPCMIMHVLEPLSRARRGNLSNDAHRHGSLCTAKVHYFRPLPIDDPYSAYDLPCQKYHSIVVWRYLRADLSNTQEIVRVVLNHLSMLLSIPHVMLASFSALPYYTVTCL